MENSSIKKNNSKNQYILHGPETNENFLKYDKIGELLYDKLNESGKEIALVNL